VVRSALASATADQAYPSPKVPLFETGAHRLPNASMRSSPKASASVLLDTSAREVIERHADLAVSPADASILVLADRHETVDVLALDQRHFRVLSSRGKPFRILPADADV
jgi:hypothetical protein